MGLIHHHVLLHWWNINEVVLLHCWNINEVVILLSNKSRNDFMLPVFGFTLERVCLNERYSCP